ncbi:hypothetical protein F0P96_13955 [Hymenobacter busanensis]|uniref:Uncharacterized protein n=1 Tax=Hymenobacter busanensis TaxID=2607656 RepID=A0A7L5A3L7_9BACT|nr:hypothetical protein [Hymenobacter busanensis]KAA9331347.1 hypothetical protein F0P96_13955 [Hymenobacter busanensis]QHJ08500.1 hypothetical protein GUY19_14880 [Hymenobacter busanensis]
MNRTLRERSSTLVFVLLCALVLIGPALYNGFPLVTSDSGAYINSGFHADVPDDRPVTYGLFIWASSLTFSLWFVILAQALVLAAVLLRCLRLLAPAGLPLGWQLLLTLLTLWATGAGWFCSQLMPDIFTAIGLLTLALLLLDGELRGFWRGAALLLLLASAMMHSSNLLIYTLVVAVLLVCVFSQHLVRRQLIRKAALVQVTSMVLLSWVALPSLHAALGGGFAVSRSSYMFVMGRLLESGVLDKFLTKNCTAESQYRLCQFRDKLPNDAITFLWDANSVPGQTGGWEANRAEYEEIIRNVLTHPRYYPALASEAVQATLRQLASNSHGDGLFAYRENSNPYWKVQEYFNYELREYLSSLQQTSRLTFTDLNERLNLTLLLTTAALLLLLGTPLRQHLSPTARLWLVICLTGVVANAGVTGGLANVLSRLQTRVVWVLPWSVLLIVASHAPALVAAQRRKFKLFQKTL